MYTNIHISEIKFQSLKHTCSILCSHSCLCQIVFTYCLCNQSKCQKYYTIVNIIFNFASTHSLLWGLWGLYIYHCYSNHLSLFFYLHRQTSFPTYKSSTKIRANKLRLKTEKNRKCRQEKKKLINVFSLYSYHNLSRS